MPEPEEGKQARKYEKKDPNWWRPHGAEPGWKRQLSDDPRNRQARERRATDRETLTPLEYREKYPPRESRWSITSPYVPKSADETDEQREERESQERVLLRARELGYSLGDSARFAELEYSKARRWLRTDSEVGDPYPPLDSGAVDGRKVPPQLPGRWLTPLERDLLDEAERCARELAEVRANQGKYPAGPLLDGSIRYEGQLAERLVDLADYADTVRELHLQDERPPRSGRFLGAHWLDEE